MIFTQFERPDETILRMEKIKNHNEVEYSVLRELASDGDFARHITIKLGDSMSDLLRLTSDEHGRKLALRPAFGGGTDEGAATIMNAAYMITDPPLTDLKFFSLYPLIMSGTVDGRTDKWQLTGIKVYADYLECDYSDGKRLNLVQLRNPSMPLAVRVVEPSFHFREALWIHPTLQDMTDNSLQANFHPLIGKMTGYKVSHIKSMDALTFWDSLSVVRGENAPGKTYLLERNWTLLNTDEDYLREQLMLGENCCKAYTF